MTRNVSDYRRLASLYALEGLRRAQRGTGAWRVSLERRPERLLVAPTDLRIGDPFIADEIYAGRFPLAGRVLQTAGASPFELPPPSGEFACQLHSFRWLRHLRAAGHELAFANARALTDDWIRTEGRSFKGFAWREDVAARRLIAWLSHSPVILKSADRIFYRRFLAALSVHIRFLRRVAASAPEGEIRLRVRIALAMATLALPASAAAIRAAARRLDAEIDRQILPDGGHVSRNPQAVLDLLADLLPLRQTYVNLGHGSPGRLISAVDRMFPALRFFRHANGELALFNGAGTAPPDRLLSVLRYDETSGTPFRHLPHSRFQRLSTGATVLIADTGPPPPAPFSRHAHAGCLSFEMSSGRHRLIVNAGVPLVLRDDYAHLVRSSAAHSTAILADTSSSRLSRSPFLGPIVADGVTNVTVAMEDGEDGSRGFTATHDGYVAEFGLIHERRLRLSADGTAVTGRDRFHHVGGAAPGAANAYEAVARFHLHPKVVAERSSAHDIVLTLPDGSRWTFLCLDVFPEIQDDVFFADVAGPRVSRQIALPFRVAETPEIQWALSRI